MEPELAAGADGPVTTTVTRRIKPGHEAAYEGSWPASAAPRRPSPATWASRSSAPPPARAASTAPCTASTRPPTLRTWLDSPERAAWLARAEPHVAGPVRTQVLTGPEGWFTLPTQPGTPPPPRSKMALVTWATIFPLITGVVVATAPLLGPLPLVARLAVTTGITVPLMTWVVMPQVTRLLGRWLYPDRPR